MKKIVLTFLLICIGLISNAQCLCSPSGTQYPSSILSPTSSWQHVSCQYAGEYSLYYVTTGNTYEWSYCVSDGGSASYDTQLGLYDNSNLSCLAWNDDYCPLSSKITWTATFTGVVRVKTNEYYCNTNSTCTDLVYRGTTSNCTNWYTVPSSDSYNYSGGSGSFEVYASGSCSFYATSNDSWINNITYPGGGYVDYDIDYYSSCVTRTGYIYIYDASSNILETTIAITQTGSGSSTCTGWYTVPSSNNVSSSGGTNYLLNAYVSSGSCNFHAISNVNWINNITSQSGGQLNYDVDANTSCSSRTGYLYIYDDCYSNYQLAFQVYQSATSGSAPYAYFTYGNAFSSLTVSFNNLSQNCSPCTCFWDFGDGTNSSLCNPYPHTYPYFDTGCPILQVTNSCGTSFSGIPCISVGIQEISDENIFIISPNPASDILNVSIKFHKPFQQIKLSLLNALGKISYSEEYHNLNSGTFDKTINLQTLESGIYLLQISIDDEPVIHRKIVIQK